MVPGVIQTRDPEPWIWLTNAVCYTRSAQVGANQAEINMLNGLESQMWQDKGWAHGVQASGLLRKFKQLKRKYVQRPVR